MLSAYCLAHNPDLQYCQGMNYLAALILVGVEMDQPLAFSIFTHLIEQYHFDNFYDSQMSKL